MKNNMTYKRPGQYRAFLAIAWYSLRAQTRNPATFFFGFIFPLVFISIFGLIGGGPQRLTVGIPAEQSVPSEAPSVVIPIIKKQSFVTLKIDDKAALEQQLKAGKIAGIIEEQPSEDPTQRTIIVTTSSANPVEAATLTSLMHGIVDQSNLRLSGVTQPPITLKQEEISGRQFRYIDYALPGQIGFALLSTAIFGTVFGLIYLKKTGVLKRMFATPTKPLTILVGQGTSRLIVALAQTVVILLVGVLAFKFYLPHGIATFFNVIILSALGLIAFLGFGYFIAGLSNDENAASPLANLITLPQFLLSGTFFSTENFPVWLQPIANNLPLTYFNTAIRKVTTEGGTLADTVPYMIGLLIWGIIMYVLAAKTFKWE